jgi:hypothetical protein
MSLWLIGSISRQSFPALWLVLSVNSVYRYTVCTYVLSLFVRWNSRASTIGKPHKRRWFLTECSPYKNLFEYKKSILHSRKVIFNVTSTVFKTENTRSYHFSVSFRCCCTQKDHARATKKHSWDNQSHTKYSYFRTQSSEVRVILKGIAYWSILLIHL